MIVILALDNIDINIAAPLVVAISSYAVVYIAKDHTRVFSGNITWLSVLFRDTVCNAGQLFLEITEKSSVKSWQVVNFSERTRNDA